MGRWLPTLKITPADAAWSVVHHRQQFLCGPNGVLLDREWLSGLDLPVLGEQWLGLLDGRPVSLFEVAAPVEPAGLYWQGLRHFMVEEADRELVRMLCQASQIGTWAGQHRFCGSCGSAMLQLPGERAMSCAACGVSQYPRLSPCMIVLISRGDEVLLARSPRHAPGMYSTLAGFVEPGESVEQCVEREVMEEVGVTISDIQYVGSQNWPFPHSLMLGFHARYESGDIVPQPSEIEDAGWFSIDALPVLPGPQSIARYLIDLYVAQRRKRPLPPKPA